MPPKQPLENVVSELVRFSRRLTPRQVKAPVSEIGPFVQPDGCPLHVTGFRQLQQQLRQAQEWGLDEALLDRPPTFQLLCPEAVVVPRVNQVGSDLQECGFVHLDRRHEESLTAPGSIWMTWIPGLIHEDELFRSFRHRLKP